MIIMLRRTQSTNCLERRQHLLTNSDSIAPVTSLDMLRMYIIYIYERRCAISNLLSNDVVLGNQLYISKCLNFYNLCSRQSRWWSRFWKFEVKSHVKGFFLQNVCVLTKTAIKIDSIKIQTSKDVFLLRQHLYNCTTSTV